MIYRMVAPTAILTCASVFLGTPNVSSAQHTIPSDPSPMTELADLSQFAAPSANWQLAGAVYSDRNNAKTLAVTKQGRGVLANLQTDELKGNIFTQFEHQDLELELEVMVPKGSNSGIYFQGRYEVQIRDSWRSLPLKPSDMGGIYYRFHNENPRGQRAYEGTAPPFDAARAPGLWQSVRVVFEAPEFDQDSPERAGSKTKNAVFREVWLNGSLLHENVEVTGPTRSAAFDDEKPWGPLMIQGDHGPVAYRNIRYRLLRRSHDGEIGEQPQLMRGHLRHGGKLIEHVLAVGSPLGVHYAFDLDMGTALSAWNGPFLETVSTKSVADTSQLLKPLGATVILSGRPALALLESDESPWPPNVDPGYVLDEIEIDDNGSPVIHYQFGGMDAGPVTVATSLHPLDGERRGLTVSTSLTADQDVWLKLAAATEIADLSDGVFHIDTYYIDVNSLGNLKPVLRSSEGLQELLVKIPAGRRTVSYTLFW